jgi:dihydrofolate reductase
MRHIIMFNWVTADGYFAGTDGNLDWVIADDEQSKTAAEAISTLDTVIFGRRTYELFEKFWPNADDSSGTAPDPHHPGRRTKEHGAVAAGLNEMTKLVFSKTLQQAAWKNSRIIREFDPREIEAMKQQPGKDMIIFGSGSIVSQLTQHGLIDIYQFLVCPVLLGTGRQLFFAVSKTSRLKLQKSKAHRSGNVMLIYERAS